MTTELNGVRDRVTALEAAKQATRQATPPWWVWVPALAAGVAVLLTLAQLYGGK